MEDLSSIVFGGASRYDLFGLLAGLICRRTMFVIGMAHPSTSQRAAWAPGCKRQAPQGGCPRHSRCSSKHRRPVVNPMCLLGVPHVESLLAASRREGRHPGRKSRHITLQSQVACPWGTPRVSLVGWEALHCRAGGSAGTAGTGHPCECKK
jgi:hypothetical protein